MRLVKTKRPRKRRTDYWLDHAGSVDLLRDEAQAIRILGPDPSDSLRLGAVFGGSHPSPGDEPLAFKLGEAILFQALDDAGCPKQHAGLRKFLLGDDSTFEFWCLATGIDADQMRGRLTDAMRRGDAVGLRGAKGNHRFPARPSRRIKRPEVMGQQR